MRKNMRKMVEEQASKLVDEIRQMDWRNERVYADFLSQIYYYVCHTTRILAAAGSRFPLERQDLHHSCLRHAAEEKSHEQLTLSDLKELGFRAQEFPELPATKALYRSAYYLVERESPVALVGYAYFLEFLAVAGGNPLLEIVGPIYGAKATRHVTVHAKEDPEHILAVERMLESLTEKELAWVEEGLMTAAAQFKAMLGEVRVRNRGAGVTAKAS